MHRLWWHKNVDSGYAIGDNAVGAFYSWNDKHVIDGDI